MEIAEKLALTDIPSSSFLKNSGIFEAEDKKIYVRTSNEFAVTMLSRPKTKEALCFALSSCLGREITQNDVTVEVNNTNEADDFDIIDELLND